ncbi:MAG: molybdenum cofactor guanylyltransferase [Syntrophomonas sp.]
MHATGVIMAGGRSSRMKFNKAFAEIGSRPVINIIINKFINFFDETIIISNDPEQYATFNLPTYSDVYPRLGPVSGIHSALYYASFDKVFVLGCDMPFMSMKLVEHMLDQLEDHEAAVPELDGYLQPISAAYSKKCLPVLTNCLNNNLLKLVLVFKELDTLKLKESELRRFGEIREMFFNVNDPEALNEARIIAGRVL